MDTQREGEGERADADPRERWRPSQARPPAALSLSLGNDCLRAPVCTTVLQRRALARNPIVPPTAQTLISSTPCASLRVMETASTSRHSLERCHSRTRLLHSSLVLLVHPSLSAREEGRTRHVARLTLFLPGRDYLAAHNVSAFLASASTGLIRDSVARRRHSSLGGALAEEKGERSQAFQSKEQCRRCAVTTSVCSRVESSASLRVLQRA